MDAVTLVNAHRLLRLIDWMRANQPRSPLMQKLNEWGLSMSHLRLLSLLAPDHEQSMRELADALGITPPSLTALTRRLVQNGLVARRPHPADSRIMLLSLTEAGRQLHRDLETERVNRIGRLLAGLPHAEQQMFLDLLERAIRA
ncbi:MarR family winged helix-turn-helix transcriptional regulator [Chloroflexus sp.]|uniref:MarR family winged helix-turn-helix transcriptional regulator n=1 Tax=Chloroflexus sp. TaxID=1904827 RepID=UPI00262AC27C|nr:MarR family transcriptional regulator [uncultured Chloroflexus sp.]